MNTFFATSLPRRELSWPGSIKNNAATRKPSVPKPIPAMNASSTRESKRPRSGSKLDGVVQFRESCDAAAGVEAITIAAAVVSDRVVTREMVAFISGGGFFDPRPGDRRPLQAISFGGEDKELIQEFPSKRVIYRTCLEMM